MATNTSNIHNNTSHKDCMRPLPASQCIPWLVLLITECLAIVILNTITIIVFVKQRQLHRRSTYLIIHLAIVDLLAGAVSGPLYIESRMTWYCNLWKFEKDFTWLFRLKLVFVSFPIVSLINLAAVSLERLHATFRPFRHRFIKKWVYAVIITVIWLTTAGIQAAEQLQVLQTLTYFQIHMVYFSYVIIHLFVICVSYTCIFIKVRCSGHPQHHGAAGVRETKLTSTLSFVTITSLFTWFPHVVNETLLAFHTQVFSNLSWQSRFHIDMTIQIIYFANSIVNPTIYALRMPELRAGVSQLFLRNPIRFNPVDLPLQNL